MQSHTMGSTDIQAQMILMWTESFSKLSTALVDKNQDTKSEWPKFYGDAKKFRAWYLSIMAQISLPPWQEFYDQANNTVVESNMNIVLNGKLYAKLLVSLEEQALQDDASRSHLRANGVLLLQELIQTYKPCHVPGVIAAKAGEFWSITKRGPNEWVDSYYDCFHELLKDLSEVDDKISTKSAMRHFILTLGPEFEPIQNNYCMDNLPAAWKTSHWPTLLILCCDFYNSVNPKGISLSLRETSMDFTNRMSQQKKVHEWFLHPAKYCKEIEKEQRKYPDMCIYHLSKTQGTNDCFIKKECEKIQPQKKDLN